MDSEPTLAQPPAARLRTRQNIAVRWIIVAAFLLMICVGVGFNIYTLREGTLAAWAEYPETVRVGDSFELRLYLENQGLTDISVQDIDLSPAAEDEDSILIGATVKGTEPDMNSYEIDQQQHAYTYGRVVSPGETQTVTFYFQAVKAGEFHTDAYVFLSTATSFVWDIGITITP